MTMVRHTAKSRRRCDPRGLWFWEIKSERDKRLEFISTDDMILSLWFNTSACGSECVMPPVVQREGPP
jgi:hypothetical protein